MNIWKMLTIISIAFGILLWNKVFYYSAIMIYWMAFNFFVVSLASKLIKKRNLKKIDTLVA